MAQRTHENFVECGVNEAKLKEFCKKHSPKKWAAIIRDKFECPIMRAWVASTVWWRRNEENVPELEELMEDYPNEDNPYPLVKLVDAFKQLGVTVTVDRNVLKRDESGLTRRGVNVGRPLKSHRKFVMKD